METVWEIEDSNCWAKCGRRGGLCEACGFQGYCCSGNPSKSHRNGDCPEGSLYEMAKFYNETGNGRHSCVSPVTDTSGK